MNTLKHPDIDILNKYLAAMVPKASIENAKVAVINGNIIVSEADNAFLIQCPLIEPLSYIGNIGLRLNIQYDLEKIILDNSIYNELYYLSNYIFNDVGNVLSSIISMRESDPVLSNMINNIKSEDGCKFYKLNNEYFVPIMTGFPYIGKSEDMDIFIHSCKSFNDYLYIREVSHKKKLKSPITTVIKILKY